MSKLCDNCKREPEPFRIKGCNGSLVGYWFVIQEGDDSPYVLMSNLEYEILVCSSPNPDPHSKDYFLCAPCFAAMCGSEDGEEE